MTDYVQVHSHRGRLYYLPPQSSNCTAPCRIFQERRRRPQRIRICNVADDSSWNKPFKPKVVKQDTFDKLAISRENAKRFLRSFIAPDKESDKPSRRASINPLAHTPVPSSHAGSRARQLERPVERQTSHTSQSSESTESSQTSSATRSSSETRAASTRQNSTSSIGTVSTNPTMRSSNRNSVAGIPMGDHTTRPTLDTTTPRNSSISASRVTTRPWNSKSMTSSVTKLSPEEKPLASGNGISIEIHLTEPVLFLQGYEREETTAERNTAMLRGSLHLKITKPTKIKVITLNFAGRAITKWPEGIPPKKVEFEEKNTIMKHVWPFFNFEFPHAETGTNADRVQLAKSSTISPLDALRGDQSSNGSRGSLAPRDLKKLSLSTSQSRSFGKGESPSGGPSVAQKGYRIFQPGDYAYNFELPLDSRLSESIEVELGSVKYELEAIVERAGAFRANLMGTKEVQLIRIPSEGSLEQVEPIAISRNWEDQLHYDIVISGKSFPLGAQVPIAFKLTPLAKVQCHRIKVLVTENVEYWCSNKHVHRTEPARKILLFEKRADSPAQSAYPGGTMRIVSGGGVPFDQRAAAARGEEVNVQDPSNILGNLSGAEHAIGPTEMEFSVQLPSCHQMRDKERTQRLHPDTTYSNISVHHWIKIVMRLSRPDTQDPTKRRHFEISIDSPFHILSCRATQANTALPAYSSPDSASDDMTLHECGCPGASARRGSPAGFNPSLDLHNVTTTSTTTTTTTDNPGLDLTTQSPGLARPAQAHLGGPISQELQRPMHLLRAPSYQPPAFENDVPPPALITPPPQYDTIASPTSGLADYFSRLSDAYDEDSDDESRRSRGRIDVPLTPGGRVTRSMDEPRTWLPMNNAAAQ